MKGSAQLTEPVLNVVLLYRAGSTISHDLEKGSHLAPRETASQCRQRVLRVGLLRSFQATHSSLGDLLDGDHLVGEIGESLLPDCLVEGVGVGEVSIGPTESKVSPWSKGVMIENDIPDRDIMLEDAVATEVFKIKRTSRGVLGASPDSLCEKKDRIALLDVEAVKHAISEFLQVNVPAIAR